MIRKSSSHNRTFVSAIRRLMNRSPLWLTFSLLMAVSLTVTSFSLSYSNYRWSTANEIRHQNASTEELIRLKLQNLDSYFNELSDFCVLPVYDTDFYQTLLSGGELDDNTLSSMQQTVSLNYYSRTDLTAYRIDMLNHNISIGREAGDQRMKTVETGTDVRQTTEYKECLASAKGYAVFPAESPSSLLRFCHTIIRINDKWPAALVTVEVTPAIMSTGFTDQIIALYNQDGELLYTNGTGEIRELLETEAENASSDGTVTLAGESYLRVQDSSSVSGLTLTAYTPLAAITREFSGIRNFSLFQSFLFLAISLAITILLIRYLTAPLSTLASSQKQLASGNFPKIDIGRCRETTELSNSFNDMSEHIDRLVNDNLIASLNEKNARLEAMEAQINPHFLYNTLQAIGSEALLNDQEEIYDMLTKLAANMRYSINGRNEVTLEEELRFTDNYIDLQKLRMEDRLQVTRRIDHDLLAALVPKCSLQLIVENSIKYGLSGDVSCLHIEIDAFRQGKDLVIRVYDDGAGMSAARLEEVRTRLENYRPGDTGEHGSVNDGTENDQLPAGSAVVVDGSSGSNRVVSYKEGRQTSGTGIPSTGVGLLNLYSRLKIMYNNQADIHVESSDSVADHHTCVTLILEEQGDPETHKPR